MPGKCNWLFCALLTEVMRADIYLNFLETGLQDESLTDFTWNPTNITLQARNTDQALRFEGLSCSSDSPLAHSRVSHWLQWSEKELFTQCWLHWKDVNLKSVWVTGAQQRSSERQVQRQSFFNRCAQPLLKETVLTISKTMDIPEETPFWQQPGLLFPINCSFVSAEACCCKRADNWLRQDERKTLPVLER